MKQNNLIPDGYKSKGKQGYLVSAARAARDISWLGVSGTLFGFSTFGHHDGKTRITTHGVFVSWFTRVDSRCIRGVAVPSLERIEVKGTAGSVGVPLGVNDLLRFVIPKFVIEFTIDKIGKNTGGEACTEGSRCKCAGRCHEGEKCYKLVLFTRSIVERVS